VGEYNADLIVEDSIAIELKAVEYLVEKYENQLINYLKATNIEAGLLLNFGKKAANKNIRQRYETNAKISTCNSGINQ
jgi:GxxExxY protein